MPVAVLKQYCHGNSRSFVNAVKMADQTSCESCPELFYVLPFGSIYICVFRCFRFPFSRAASAKQNGQNGSHCCHCPCRRHCNPLPPPEKKESPVKTARFTSTPWRFELVTLSLSWPWRWQAPVFHIAKRNLGKQYVQRQLNTDSPAYLLARPMEREVIYSMCFWGFCQGSGVWRFFVNKIQVELWYGQATMWIPRHFDVA